MLKGLFILLMFWFCQPLLGQVIHFNKAYDVDLNINNASAAIQTSDSGFLFVTCVYNVAYGAFCIVKTDSDGDTLWTKEYRKNGAPFAPGASGSLIRTLDSNFVFCGRVSDSASTNADAFLLKFKPNGDTLWTKHYGGNSFDQANIIHQLADSGFVLIGTSQSFGNGSSDFYIIRTDANGNLQWQNNYGGAGTQDAVSGQPTLDGGFILSGANANSLYLIKISITGAFQWDQVYTGYTGFGFVKQLSDSSYLLAGQKNVIGFNNQGALLKIDKNGSVIWWKHYGLAGSDEIFFSRPLILNDNSIVIAGSSVSNNIPWGWAVKCDSSGNQIFMRTYYKNSSADNYFYDLINTNDGGFLFSGFAILSTSDAWLVKTDSLGCEVAGCDAIGIPEVNYVANTLQLFPNPNNGESLEVITAFEGANATLAIYDLTGRCVHRTSFSKDSKSGSIGLRGFPDGVYFVRVVYPNGEMQTQRLLIAK